MAKSTAKKSATKPAGNTITVAKADGDSDALVLARTVLRPSITGAVTIEQFSKQFGALDLPALIDGLAEQSKAVYDGDLKRAEALLMTQAHTLDAIFNNLAQKAARAEYMNNLEKYLRLALKAQSQCRATLQTLGELKNPPIVYAKQANITSGPQQINNGVAAPALAHAEKNINQQNELLEAQAHEQLDTRAPSATSGVNQTLETVAAVDRASNGGR